MFQVELASIAQRERLMYLETPEGRFRREWFAYREIDRLKSRLNEARQALRVASAN